MVKSKPTLPPPADCAEPDAHAGALYRFADPAYVPRAATLAELRQHIDALDEQIVALLAQRAACTKDAARFKPTVAHVPALARQQQVFERVRQLAAQHNPGLPGFEDVVEQTYCTLVAGLVATQAGLHGELVPLTKP